LAEVGNWLMPAIGRCRQLWLNADLIQKRGTSQDHPSRFLYYPDSRQMKRGWQQHHDTPNHCSWQ